MWSRIRKSYTINRKSVMNDDLERRIREAMANPQNMGELPNADAVGTVGNSECGEMLRMWIKYKEERGKKVIDKATFQSFGCETAIAVASLATELIKGKTAEEALSLKTNELIAPSWCKARCVRRSSRKRRRNPCRLQRRLLNQRPVCSTVSTSRRKAE